VVSSHTESTMWPGSRTVSDLELLQIEIDMLWGINQARLIDGPDLVVACASTGVFATVSKAVPEDVARAVLGEVADVRVPADISAPPPLLERWRRLLEDVLGEIELAPGSGPSYLIEDHVAFPASIPLVRSDAEDFGRLRGANPGNWGADEWQDLLDGRRGPWVMARHADHVISICHTPVSSTRAAEAGVWTHPDFRGHGYAAATTAEWAALVRPSGRLLFYSTSRTNWSSQKVAARLGLRPIGFRWQLRRLCPRAGT
jgi:GNAT superfamily N-acetyltransferase